MLTFHLPRLQFFIGSVLVICSLTTADVATSTTSVSDASLPIFPTISPSDGTCESRTINYITYNPFASICFQSSSPQAADATDGTPSPISYSTKSNDGPTIATPTIYSDASTTTSTDNVDTSTIFPPVDEVRGDFEEEALQDAAFLSFEDWKKQILEKAKSDPDTMDINREAGKGRRVDGGRDSLDALEDDGEIDIDFGAFLGSDREDHRGVGAPNHDRSDKITGQSPQDEDGDSNDSRRRYRSKDAGKTCKERTNFASMDLGAQLLKTNPEAKSASALLSENRDAYMLNDCQAKNKFLIVELSESILVETLAIANFEFFSSTFRQFRISVSDRYPVKLDRWVDLGTFEARNSRDLQAFLVEDPRIWARYLRLEFLSHYGNEFYCPVSLLRVHGRTMIQDVLSMEQASGNDDSEPDDVGTLLEAEGEKLQPDAIAEVLKEEERVVERLKDAQVALDGLIKTAEDITPGQLDDALNSSHLMDYKRLVEDLSEGQMTTTWNRSKYIDNLFAIYRVADVCLPSEGPSRRIPAADLISNQTNSVHNTKTDRLSVNQTQIPEPGAVLINAESSESVLNEDSFISSGEIPAAENAPLISSEREPSASASPSTVNLTTNATLPATNKSTATHTSHPSQPTTQESFFKSISKRLQLLESNSTLSLKYIEEQSKILREAFSKVERRQLSKTTSFLGNLNNTVLTELRRFGHQYDQIWQSTVIELENQREASQREIAAVSARLNMLADELVFQKRMSIVQSVLLLLCLGLVVFSRSLASGLIDAPMIQNLLAKSRNLSDGTYYYDTNSPISRRAYSPSTMRPWLHTSHDRHESDGSDESMVLKSRDDYPPTHFSASSVLKEEEAAVKGSGLPSRNTDEGAESRKESKSIDGARPQEPLSGQQSDTYSQEVSPSTTMPPSAINLNLPETGSPPRMTWKGCATDLSSMSGGINEQEPKNSISLGFHPESIEYDKSYHLRRNMISSPRLPSPPPERLKGEFSIARKPLPALPHESK